MRQVMRLAAAVAVVCMLGGCGGGYRSKDETAREHFAVGKNWPQAVTSIESSFGDQAVYSVSCKAESGPDFGFARDGVNFFGPSGEPYQDLGSFRRAVLGYFTARRCASATVVIDNRVEVSLRIQAGTITETAVRRI